MAILSLMSNRALGPIYIAIAASLWGLSAAVAKLFFTQDIDTLVVIQTRSTFACLLLAPLALLSKGWRVASWREGLRVLPLGVVGVAGSNFTYYYAVDRTTVATAIVLQYTAPIMVAVYQALFEGRRLSLVDAGIILLVLFGSYVTVAGPGAAVFGPGMAVDGLLAGVASAVCWAFFNLYERRLGDIPLRAKLFTSLLCAALFWALVQNPWALARKIPDARVFGLLVGFAFLSILLPYIFYFGGLRRCAPLPAIVTANIEPVMAILFSALIVGAVVPPSQMFGALCVVVGATLFNVKSLRAAGRAAPAQVT